MPFKSVIGAISDHFHPKMDAVGITHNGPLEAEDAFIERTVNKPMPRDNEVLVQVLASAVNPVDTKMRAGYTNTGVFRIFGLDVVGRVAAVGSCVTRFSVGDRVFYAGKQRQAGADAAYQVVDSNLIAHAPSRLDDVAAAAMPLTSVTAHDIMHHGFHLPVERNAAREKALLVLNGAGGVGSVLIQLAKYMGMTVLATAGNPESKKWVHKMGADFVLDYHLDLVKQTKAAGFDQVDYIANLQDTTGYWDLMVRLIRPYGQIASIVDTTVPVDLGELKSKAASFSWVYMLARGNENVYLAEQGQILEKISQLLESGDIKSTVTKVYHGLTANNIRHANLDVAGHHVYGKVVVDFAPNIMADGDNLGPEGNSKSDFEDRPDDVKEVDGLTEKEDQGSVSEKTDE
ncbi:zinc-binding alcohol dehydrogenase family protein [Fructobacillus sp. M2-14]|uniref:Zinc-binding alcohol dehydrogenase family protein n=1 Tax=Fructobacillus broussonetiae TaxID=2713173 RepID=A0ABS5R026_9LACO|nr:zinc-binding alcohol dehydrogenase family protein [Fructobacillus broussonetiae]MBS9338255.1 zinc-binding alcohol dehydrogenase family protein [Fructobacillus broussonetiae]